MSVKCSSWAWNQAVVNSGRKLVLLALADRANDDGECWPGLACLAEKCSMPRRTLIRALQDLQEAGLLSVDHRPGDGGGRSTNIYRLALTQPQEGAKCQPDTRQSATESLAKCQPDTTQGANLTLGKVPKMGGQSAKSDRAKCQIDTRQSAKNGGAKCQSLAPNTSVDTSEKQPSVEKQPSGETRALSRRAREKPVASLIADDWQPSERARAILADCGINRAFAESCVPEFVLYWAERGEKRPGWDASFVNRAKDVWARRPASAAPGGGRVRKEAGIAAPLTPQGAEFDALLRNLSRPAIEGELAHASL